MIRPGDQERPGRTNVLALGDRPFTAHKAPAEVQGGGRCVGHGGCYRRCAWRDVGFTAAGWEGGRGVAVASAWCGAAVCVSSHRLQWHRCGPGGVSTQDGRYIPTQLIAGVFRCCGGSGCLQGEMVSACGRRAYSSTCVHRRCTRIPAGHGLFLISCRGSQLLCTVAVACGHGLTVRFCDLPAARGWITESKWTVCQHIGHYESFLVSQFGAPNHCREPIVAREKHLMEKAIALRCVY